ncbi:sel1 repeat family protein [Megamonas hypermegale]|nr:sel1 repeat family protein [Megamonas hypermegale]
MESLRNEESYIVDTVNNYMKQYDVEVNRERICDDLTDKYLQEKALVNINIDVDSYDMILDLLYNLKQAESENLIVLPLNEQIQEAEQAYLKGDFKKAFDICSLLANNNNGRAMCFMGLFYQFGCENFIKIDEEQANIWFKKGMALGDPLCIWAVANKMPSGSNEKEKLFSDISEDIIRLAENKDPFAQCKLGLMYGYGNGVKEDKKEAVKWYRKSAEQGYSRGQNCLGYMYDFGYGVEEDKKEAVEWYKKAAEQGYSRAQNNLGIMYEYGKGVTKDYKEAVKWYRKAAEQDYSKGQYNLGDMYEYGKGVTKDCEEAVKWYKKAAEQGNIDAKKALERISVSL